MAAGIYDINALGNALHTVYDPKIRNLVVEENFFLSSLEKGDAEAYRGGKGYEWYLQVNPNTSYGLGLSDGLEVPDPGRRTDVLASTDILDHWSSVGLTKKAIARAQKGEKSFITVLDQAQKEVVTDLRTEVSHQLYMRPAWEVTADSSGTTITLNSTQYIRIGSVLEIGNRTTGAGAAMRTVTGKDNSAGTITVDTAITVTAAASGAWMPGHGPTATRKIDTLTDAAGVNRTLHGINSTTVHAWNGNTKALGGTVADEDDFGEIKDQIWERGQGKVTDALTTTGIQRRFAKQMQSNRRLVNEGAVTIRGGFSAVFLDNIPLVAEQEVPKGHLFAYDKSAMTLLTGDSGFEKTPGSDSIWKPQISSNNRYKTAYQASYMLELNVLYNTPGAIGSLTGCQDGKPPAGL